ncbi:MULTISPECIES: SRPBCC domain-containing protein [unclassified Caulobacter]|uniref:SRPBCC family protein n=1 Tax=unclassified Caulobacter TaxID=2648921 RepID=UPI0006FF5FDC|nr:MULTISPECIES: SRPBCC family protein [unclassified Caulobacter]KQV62122.1 ATPase [Caulobacter sp. Root342]KQV64827.1 ATPase [Caulobacter sp. Root343]
MKTMSAVGIAVAAVALLAAGGARAEVIDAQANGFEVRHEVVVTAPASAIWATLVQPSKWWTPAHTWSGSAANLSLGAASGGCFCERLPNGGSVLHMTTVYAAPGARLVLSGALGPLQTSGASGALTVLLAEKDGRTTVTVTYDVGGYFKGGLDKIAGAVDGVIGQQVAGLKAAVEGATK